jgi:L-ascorbate 6-phosphate lactonase
MGQGMWYDMRLGKPLPPANLRSEWRDWFLTSIDGYSVKEGSVALWALGNAGFVLKTSRTTLYIDPYCGGSIAGQQFPGSAARIFYRMSALPFNPSDVRKIDAEVITHEDLDHLNEDFVFPVFQNTQCLFIGPPSTTELLESWKIPKERIVSLSEYQERKINDIRVIACPSYDPIAKTANTYVFEIGTTRIFHSGDAQYFDKFVEIGKKFDIDVALLGLGTSPPGMKMYNNPGDVVQIARELGAKVIVPMHWDMWSALLENPYLVEEEVRIRRQNMRVIVLRIGERFEYRNHPYSCSVFPWA